MASTRRRVVLVDDNELTRAGFGDALRGDPEIDVLAGLDHEAALAWTDEWAAVDVVLVDAADEGREGDQFPGVRLVRHIHTLATEAHPTVIVITGHFFDDGLRHRMREAGADFFFLRPEVRSADKLRHIVTHPESYRRGVPAVADPQRRRQLGVTPRSDVEKVVRYVEDEGISDELGGAKHKGLARSRRWWSRHREELGRAGKINPVNSTTGHPPNDSGRRAPSRPQIARLWQWAARVKYGPVEEPGQAPPDQE